LREIHDCGFFQGVKSLEQTGSELSKDLDDFFTKHQDKLHGFQKDEFAWSLEVGLDRLGGLAQVPRPAVFAGRMEPIDPKPEPTRRHDNRISSLTRAGLQATCRFLQKYSCLGR
jgi:hypothetical protein